jgi:hypothetical protein
VIKKDSLHSKRRVLGHCEVLYIGNITLWSPARANRRYGETNRMHFHAGMLFDPEGEYCSSETSIDFHQTTR